MLSKKKIDEANTNLKSYLFDGLISKEEFHPLVFETFMRNHRESLLLAKFIFKENISSVWVVVVSYYSMFYMANAVLYKKGYKVGHKLVHKVTVDALISLLRFELKLSLLESYELESSQALVLTDSLIESYNFERIKRSSFQYETTEEIKLSKAQTSLTRAKEFSLELEKLL